MSCAKSVYMLHACCQNCSRGQTSDGAKTAAACRRQQLLDPDHAHLLHNDLALHASARVWLAVVLVGASSVELGAVLLPWSVQVVLMGQSLSVDASLSKTDAAN